jgi:4-hydroxymandelate oxidase
MRCRAGGRGACLPTALRPMTSRRSFLRFLAGSPVLAAFPGCGFTESPSAERRLLERLGLDPDGPVGTPGDALSVFDLEAAARAVLPPAHFGYVQTGVDGDRTLRANAAAFDRYYLRPRRLVDVSRIDAGVRLFGIEWPTPIVLAPAGSQRALHPEGELATARAARSRNHLQILSTMSSTPIEAVAEARGEPLWFQLYPTGRWDVTEQLLRRAEAAGSPVVVLTVDIPAGVSNRETLERAIRRDSRDCDACHLPGVGAIKPMFQGTGFQPSDFPQSALTWEFLSRLRDATTMKVLIKGIVTAEDAARCVERGVDGIIVSNHGGRAEESGRGSLDSLPEVAAAVRGRVPVLMDGGIRRGTDIFKALALGADAVCIGRPYLWGLGAFGQAGVERVLDLLRAELHVTMEFAGASSIGAIDSSYIGMA